MSEPAQVARLLHDWRGRVDQTIATALPDPARQPQRLHMAMRHAALLGGKRIRPLLVYATAYSLGMDIDTLDPAAAAVELIHAYSLVHDDLPAMDDDRLRRGQPTVHVAYDEATAILAGDALQSLAFALLAHAPLSAQIRVQMLGELADAAGVGGMCGGQALDIDATGQPATVDGLRHLHGLKTGALLRASVRLGAIAAQADPAICRQLDRYAEALGLAFQIRDDLLDIEGDSATLGKTAGKDIAQDKATYPAIIGIDGSRQTLEGLAATMRDALAVLADSGMATDALRQLATDVIQRDH